MIARAISLAFLFLHIFFLIPLSSLLCLPDSALWAHLSDHSQAGHFTILHFLVFPSPPCPINRNPYHAPSDLSLLSCHHFIYPSPAISNALRRRLLVCMPPLPMYPSLVKPVSLVLSPVLLHCVQLFQYKTLHITVFSFMLSLIYLGVSVS